jgi:hypothetical protein
MFAQKVMPRSLRGPAGGDRRQGRKLHQANPGHPTEGEDTMTDLIPDPSLNAAMATARRYLSALNADDHAGCAAVLVALATDRDALKTFEAMAIQCLEFARVLDALDIFEGGLQEWLNNAALAQMDVTEALERLPDDDEG